MGRFPFFLPRTPDLLRPFPGLIARQASCWVALKNQPSFREPPMRIPSEVFGIRDLKAKSGRDSGLKVCARGGMANITLGITGLAHQILGRDYWIKEPYWRFPAKWNIRNDCRNSILITWYNPDHLCQKWYIKGYKVGRQIWTVKDRKRICRRT